MKRHYNKAGTAYKEGPDWYLAHEDDVLGWWLWKMVARWSKWNKGVRLPVLFLDDADAKMEALNESQWIVLTNAWWDGDLMVTWKEVRNELFV